MLPRRGGGQKKRSNLVFLSVWGVYVTIFARRNANWLVLDFILAFSGFRYRRLEVWSLGSFVTLPAQIEFFFCIVISALLESTFPILWFLNFMVQRTCLSKKEAQIPGACVLVNSWPFSSAIEPILCHRLDLCGGRKGAKILIGTFVFQRLQ